MNSQVRQRSIAWSLLIVMVLQCAMPTTAWALTSGPSQPEVQGFTPAGSPEIVDLFTGDASYNIPIMDVEGYPINLSYKAGINMDQEASWVGLGWSLGVGQVERSVRGLPDDFSGDQMRREMSMRPNRTFGLSTALYGELFGIQAPYSLNLSISPSFNNYYGVRMEMGASLSMRSTERGKSGMNGGLGVSASSDGSMTLQPKIGFDKEFERCHSWGKAGLNFGMSISSRDGLQDVSFGASMMRGTYDHLKANGTSTIGSARFDMSSKVYSPEVSIPMDNLSVSASLTPVGLSLFGTNTGVNFGGYYSRQRLATNDYSRPAYGFLHLEQGENNPSAMLDFSREGEGPYRSEQSHLPVASLANDIFSVSSQNMNGSYRPYRGAVGHVFDAQTTCSGSGGSYGAEFGAGGVGHLGGDIIVNEQTSTCGDWTAYSSVSSRLKFGHTAGQTPETVYFREANEAVVDHDPAQFTGFGGASAQRLKLQGIGGYNAALLPQFDGGGSLPAQNALSKREPRGTVLSYLTHAEVEQGFGLEPLHGRVGSPLLVPGNVDRIRDNHISEITITGKDGSRNFYGLPAYNIHQCDVSFAMGPIPQDATTTSYISTDATIGNQNGRDYFFSKNHTPPHAYAFLLTAAVSADYSDADGVRGPSDGDLGTWHRFHYKLVDPEFHWRTPVPPQNPGSPPPSPIATAQPGLAVPEAKDDRAIYSFGIKEIWAVNAIEGRNLIAVFFTSARSDARGVDENGTVDMTDVQEKLDSIGLYTREQIYPYLAQLTPTPPLSIKTAHFAYDYALCPGTPNSNGAAAPTNTGRAQGKLTLRKVWFTYGESRRGVLSPYKFIYGQEDSPITNPSYCADCQDRWGGLRPAPTSALDVAMGGNADIPVKDFPYAIQDPIQAKALASAWNLTRIKTPSASYINVQYGADDYGYVQDAKPTTMVRLHGASVDPATSSDPALSLRNATVLKFERPPGTWTTDAEVQAALPPGLLYYRMKVDVLGGGHYDYVSGYASVQSAGIDADGRGYVRFNPQSVDEGAGFNVAPMYRSAIEFARLNYAKQVYHPSSALAFDDDDAPAEQFILATASTVLTFLTGWADLFTGPNREVINKNAGIGEGVDYSDSYIKLLSPHGEKIGGGHRVEEVSWTDSWDAMTPGDIPMSYGKRYSYTESDGSTSGVAAYEPMVGADENCLRRPVYYNESRCLSPDQRFYQEEPFAESLYPSPTVGYRRVVVTDFVPGDTTPPENQLTGFVEHQFYTARDFPVRPDITSIDEKHYTPGSFNLINLLGFKTIDNMHVSQGVAVETNDMHGKPRSVKAYPQGSTEPISTEEYSYAMDGARLSNTANVLEPNGQVYMAEIGRHYEFLADLREYRSDATSSGVAVNTDVIMLFMPTPIPTPWPKFSSERTRFRSANFVKKVHRFGLLEKVVKTENGRTVITENVAYDALTGNVLVTKVQNDFNDPVYSMTFPAYWYYDGMGPGYRNIGYRSPDIQFTAGSATGLVDADQRFVVGDELICTPSSGVPLKGWVGSVTANTLSVMDANGLPVPNELYVLRVMRSGRRNMPSVPMTTMTTLSDPLAGMASNTYSALINVQVVEYSDIWRTPCDCLASGQMQPSHNPFVVGTRGLWRLNKERAYLAERQRGTENNNSNIRRDGIYSNYAPFYRLNNGGWEKHEVGWVAVREVTDYGARGQELENKDALGMLSASTFGQRGTLPKTVVKNSGIRDHGFDDFENPVPTDCGDTHFRIPTGSGGSYTQVAAHSGRHSLQVLAGAPARLHTILQAPCQYEGCVLALEQRPGSPLEVQASGGIAPITYAPVPLSGDPVFTLLQNGLGITATGTGSFQLTATDAAGCQANITVTLP